MGSLKHLRHLVLIFVGVHVISSQLRIMLLLPLHVMKLQLYLPGRVTLLIHEGKKAEDLFLKDGTLPDPSSTDNAEFKIVLTIIKRLLLAGETDKWNKMASRCMGVSEETTTGVHRLYTM